MAGSLLSDFADIVMGQSPPGESCNTEGKGLPLLNGPTEYGSHHPTPVQFTTDARKRARPGDVLFCVRGSTTGRMNWADREYAIGRGVAAVRHKQRPELQPFVRAVIEYGLPGLLAQATGSTFPNVSTDQLSGLWWPPLEEAEQRAIAHILGRLDDKIELNRRMSETLEAMARALFKSWFIDFDPVRRNAARARNQPSPGAPRHPLPAGEGLYRGGYDYAGLVRKARELRAKQTPAEAILWELVRDRRFMGLKFRRQHQLGDYIADYYCHEHRLVVELDGGIHTEKRAKDHKRAAWMAAQGIQVLRFPNEHFLEDPQSVLLCIAETTLPSPSGGRARGEPEGQLPSPVGRRVGDEGVVGGEAFDHLFPARLVGSELGEIPEGWEVALAGSICDVAIGKTPPRKEHQWFSTDPRDVPWMSIKDLGQARAFISDVSEYITPNAVERFRVRRIPAGTVVLSFKLTVGRVAITDGEMLSNEAIAHFLPGTRTFPSAAYLYCYLRQFDYESLGSTSSIATAVNSDSVRSIPLLVPSKAAHEAFLRATSPLFSRLRALQRESRTLANVRDALLPKLISGELRTLKSVPQETPGSLASGAAKETS